MKKRLPAFYIPLRKIGWFIFVCSLSLRGLAQETRTITGTVRDTASRPLSGVTVTADHSKASVTTKDDGTFSIKVSSGDKTLAFTYIGLKPVTQSLSGGIPFDIRLSPDASGLSDVIVVGYGTKKREAITSSVATLTSKDMQDAHNGSTVSSALAGKIPGVTFNMPDSRPGASANVNIRNMGDPLYIIDGIQQDAGQFNNIAPNDIDNISVLKDASAAIYGVQAANGVILVTTKKGKLGGRNSIGINAYTGWQTWARFPRTVNNYEWQEGKVEADVNQGRTPTVTPDQLAKYKAGTEPGYQNFDWYDFIVKAGAPLTNENINFSGGSDKINYYVSGTHLKQSAVLGREFTFERTNIQSNITAKVANNLTIGANINGRVEIRDNPGVPDADDYQEAKIALLRNDPWERPYANDNPAYLNNIGHNTTNWGLLNKKLSGHYNQTWRVLQTNLSAEWKSPIPGLTFKGLFGFYYANQLLNNQENTYVAYTYDPSSRQYNVTGGSSNPWRERGQEIITSPTTQLQADYNHTFGKHSLGATFVNERISRRDQYDWLHAVPTTNLLPLIYFPTMDTYNDYDSTTSRIGYVGRIDYNYDNKYYVQGMGRRDASYILSPGHKWGNFGAVTAGWRITQEEFFQKLVNPSVLSELKLRASYGTSGDDRSLPLTEFAFLQAYNYNTSTVILNGNAVIGSAYAGVPVNNITWITSHSLDIGLDYGLWNGKISGTFDYFRRKRTGIPASQTSLLVPSELGYSLPLANLNSDVVEGVEASFVYRGKVHDLTITIGANFSFSLPKTLSVYNPVFFNSLDKYRSASDNRGSLAWGFIADGQFQSQQQINDNKVNQDGKGNKTLLPGDIIYKDLNHDGVIDSKDQRPIGWGAPGAPGTNINPIVNGGLNIGLNYKTFDFHMDFSAGSGYSFQRNQYLQVPFFQGGGLLDEFYKSHWRHQDIYDASSPWIAGKYPALTFDAENNGSNGNTLPSTGNNNAVASTFWTTNVKYIKCRNLELGYTLPKQWLSKVKIPMARFYVNVSNLFSIDNVHQYGIDPEIQIGASGGLTYPQTRMVNVGANITL